MPQGPKPVPQETIEALVRDVDQCLINYDWGDNTVSFYAGRWSTGPWFSSPLLRAEIVRRYKEAGWKDVKFVDSDPRDRGQRIDFSR